MALSKTSALWLLVCVVGCCYQVTVMTIQYAKYEISSHVKLTMEKTIKLPSVTWCTPIPYFLNWTHPLMRRICDQLLGMNCSSATEDNLVRKMREIDLLDSVGLGHKLMDLLDGSQILQVTIGIDSIIPGLLFLNTKETPAYMTVARVRDIFHVSDFVLQNVKCFTLTWKPGMDIVTADPVKKGVVPQGSYLLLFHSKELKRRAELYRFAYSDNRFKELRTGVTDFIYVPTGGGTASSYDMYVSRLLTAPFTTDCFDYTDVGLADQAECADLCMEEKATQVLGKKWYGQRLVAHDIGVKVMSFKEMKDKWDSIEEIRVACNRKCAKQDCFQETYVTNVRSSMAQVTNYVLGHGSYTSSSPTIVTDASAKQTLTEFLIVSGSCFGFWFGASILQILEIAKKVAARLKRSKGRTVQKRPQVSRKESPIHRSPYWYLGPDVQLTTKNSTVTRVSVHRQHRSYPQQDLKKRPAFEPLKKYPDSKDVYQGYERCESPDVSRGLYIPGNRRLGH